MKKFVKILITILIIIAIVFFLRFVIGGPEDDWICVDGDWVEHGVPSAPKPSTGCGEEKIECTAYPFDTCPKECVVCPPCMACSSITCQTEEFCAELGIDRSWYERIKGKLNEFRPPLDKPQRRSVT